MNPTIVLSETDARRLNLLLDQTPKGVDPESLSRLREELGRAQVLPDPEVPGDVVTLNSTVELEDLGDGEVDTFTLVLPRDADPARGRISILAPLGMGMIGYREGDEFEWPIPAGRARFKVRRLIHPENALR